MSWLQRFLKAVMPPKWFAAAAAESRTWMIRCRCGAERSVWDAGGIRWKGAGRPRTYARCAACGKRSWHVVKKLAPVV